MNYMELASERKGDFLMCVFLSAEYSFRKNNRQNNEPVFDKIVYTTI